MILYYSGSAGDTVKSLVRGEPELTLDSPHIMLSYHAVVNLLQQQHNRFKRLMRLKESRQASRHSGERRDVIG